MQVVFHLGAHFTEPSALLRSLRHNEACLAGQGVALPGPSHYLPLFMQAAAAGQASEDLRLRLLATIADRDQAERVVFSGEDLLGLPARAVVEGALYPAARDRVEMLAALFPDERIEFHMAIRSPATFLPSLLSRADPEAVRLFLDGVDLTSLRWSDLVGRMRDAAPGAPITIWCDEDMPLIWPEALNAVAGRRTENTGAGLLDRLAPLLTEEGVRRMGNYLAANPAAEPAARRSVVSEVITRYGRAEAIEMDLDLPGWSGATIDRISDLYDADVERIARMDGVRLIAP